MPALRAKRTHDQDAAAAQSFPAPVLEDTSRTAAVSAVRTKPDLIYTRFMALVDRGAERPLGSVRACTCVCVRKCIHVSQVLAGEVNWVLTTRR